MSIVERALQKAQAKSRQGEATAPPVPEPGAEESLQAAEPAEAPVTSRPAGESQSGGATVARDGSGLTSRDLKAIVHLDFERLRAAGHVPTEAMASQIDDEIRRIKWPLLKAVRGSEGTKPARNNVILVTSAMPGEGKTFASLNLALSIVRDRELRVVLVDGDVARPGLTPAIGLEGRPGLNDVLEDPSRDVSAVTYQTDVEGLFFVPAGKWHPHAPEFFAGSRMPQVVEALCARAGNGVVIFDSPPLMATNEAQVATRYAGQVLLVVQADATPQQAVVDAIALVDKGAPVSAVLSRCEPSVLSRYYGRYYYGPGHVGSPGYSQRGRGGDTSGRQGKGSA